MTGTLPLRWARRPAAAACASTVLLLGVALIVPHVAPFSGRLGKPGVALPAATVPTAGVPAVASLGVVGQAEPADLVAGHVGWLPSPSPSPSRVEKVTVPGSPCAGVQGFGAIRAVAAPFGSGSAWTDVAGGVNSGAGSGRASGRTGGSPYAALSSAPGTAPTGFVVPGGVPGQMFASDGTSLVRSGDGGCVWQPSLSLDPTASGSGVDAVPAPASVLRVMPGYVITALVAEGTRVYATIAPPWWSTVYAQVSGGAPLVVATSADSGATWTASVPWADQPVDVGSAQAGLVSQPLPAGSGYPQLLAVAPSDPKVVYLETAAYAGAGANLEGGASRMRMFVSRDGATTWAPAAVPVRPGSPSSATTEYAAGTQEDYLFQLHVDLADPRRLYGLGVACAPGTRPPGAQGLGGSQTQNGLFQSDGTLYASSDFGSRWSALASPVGVTGFGGAVMVHIDSYAVTAGAGAGRARVALVEHYLSTAMHSLTSVVFLSAAVGTGWRELPVPTSLHVFLPAEEGLETSTTLGSWGEAGSPLATDGVYSGSQPLWLAFSPGGRGLSMGLDPAPGVSWGRVSVYRWAFGGTSWTRAASGVLAAASGYDVRAWNVTPVAPAGDPGGATAYAVVQMRSAVNNPAAATANAAGAGNADVQAVTYTGPIYLLAYHA